MGAALQVAFAAALEAAATSATSVYRDVAPAGAAVPYVVYTIAGNTGPSGLYGGSWHEADVYLVSSVAASRLQAEQLADEINAALHLGSVAGAVNVRRENRTPTPAPLPDQTRFVVAYYYRVRYTDGG